MKKNIHTVTLNPVIDLIYIVPQYAKGETFRCADFRQIPAGKGLSVSYALSCLGAKSTAHILLGEDEAAVYVRECGRRGIDACLTAGLFSTRKHATILETGLASITHAQIEGPEVSQRLADQLAAKLDRQIDENSMVAFSGSLPNGVDPKQCRRMIEAANERGALSVLDSSGAPLLEGIEARPYAIKANELEAGQLTGLNLGNDDCVAAACRAIQARWKIPMVMLSLGGRGLAAANQNGIWLMHVPLEKREVVDTVGCGDAIVAGFIHAMANGLKDAELFAFAIACATAATQQPGPGFLDKSDVAGFLKQVVFRK